tara:strand:- start:3421 stop:3927 length:507 start_codon:yes stop_codon:yes gene_type:complete
MGIIKKNFKLSLNVSTPDKLYRSFVGEKKWEDMLLSSIEECNGVCQGCGYNPPNKNFLELHIISGDLKEIDTYNYTILCKTCHTLQHIDVASEKGWIKLCNSIFEQKRLISICRSGNGRLKEKINTGEIMLLNTEATSYSKLLSEDVFNKRKKMKAVFGKNFPKNRLK